MIFSYLHDGKREELLLAPSFAQSADVLVVGVGTSGSYAALGAARGGARVIALEREETIGGMYVQGRVTTFYYGESGGSYKELEPKAVEIDHACFTGKRSTTESRVAILTEALTESGVTLYTGVAVLGVFIDNATVVGARAIIEGQLTDIRCRVLIDSTSDGHIVRMCPVNIRFGRPTDGKTAPFTAWTSWLKGDGVRGLNVDDGYCNQYDPYAFSALVTRAHASKLGRMSEDTRFLLASPLPGVREGISFEGEQMLSHTDVLLSREPSKVLFYARSDLDKHGTDIALDAEEYQNFWCISNLATVAMVIPVPMGAVMPKGLYGIVTAGRCLCADSYVLGAVRMNRDMMRMGECVGILSALAAKAGVDVRDVDYDAYVAATDAVGCRRGNAPDRFAFDSPRREAGIYRPVSFDMTDEEILAALGTDSPGVAIYACRRSDGHIKPKLAELICSDDDALSLGAALALGVMGDERALARLRRAVRERSPEIFTGSRRSNQFRSVTAICLLGRMGTEEDLSLLWPIVFDGAERSREMYIPQNTPSPAYASNTLRFCYFQHFTHALVAMAKIAKRCAQGAQLLSAIEQSFDARGTEELLEFINGTKTPTPIGESAAFAVEYVKKLLC